MKPKTKIKQLEIFACPFEHCRKKSFTLKGLNVHIVIKHKSNFLLEIIDGNKPIARLR